MIVRLITESMVYQVGMPMPVPPGYDVQPLIITQIETVEEEDETGMTRPVMQILSIPDPEEFDRDIPQQPPEGANPSTHQKAIEYNLTAKSLESQGIRCVSTVPHHRIIRTERIVSVDEYEEIKRLFTEQADDEKKASDEGSGEQPAAQQQPPTEPEANGAQGKAEDSSELQPDG